MTSNPQTPAAPIRLYLAPMEGVVDWVMRDLLTQVGGIDQVVTEFLRVTDTKYPDHVFYRNCPELKSQSKYHSRTTNVGIYL